MGMDAINSAKQNPDGNAMANFPFAEKNHIVGMGYQNQEKNAMTETMWMEMVVLTVKLTTIGNAMVILPFAILSKNVGMGKQNQEKNAMMKTM